MKTMTSLAALVLSVALLGGCSAGATGTMKPAETGGYETLIQYDSVQMQSRLEIQDVRTRKQGDLLQVSVDLRNRWKFELDFQYQFRFYDKDGFEVMPEGRPWTQLVINGNGVSTVQATAPNPSASSFKIIVKD